MQIDWRKKWEAHAGWNYEEMVSISGMGGQKGQGTERQSILPAAYGYPHQIIVAPVFLLKLLVWPVLLAQESFQSADLDLIRNVALIVEWLRHTTVQSWKWFTTMD